MLKAIYRSLLYILILCAGYAADAQSSWHYLSNASLTTGGYSRFEDVYFTSKTTGFAVALNGGLWKTTNGGQSWNLKFDSNAHFQFRSIEFLDDGKTGIAGIVSNFYSGSQGGIVITNDSGETWNVISGALFDTVSYSTRAVCGIAHTGNTFFAVGAWYSHVAHIFKSTNRGASWTTQYIDTALATQLVDVVFTSPTIGFATGGKSGNTFPGAYGSQESVILKTTDGGATWTKVFSDTVIGGRIWKIQALSANVLVGSIEPEFRDTVAMVRSVDGGNTWTVIGTGFHKPANTLVSYGTQGIGFATQAHGWLGGYYPGIFETKDGGQTWDTLQFGNNFNRFFVIDSTHIFAGGESVYFYGNGLPNAIHPPIASQQLPHRLYPVSPNPVRSGPVKIEFDLSATTQVQLDVVNTDARQRWNVAAIPMSKGHHIYYWDPKNAPAGNYLVWLGTNEIPVVNKFTLLK